MKYLHERCLRLIYNDKCPSYEDFFQKYISDSIHHKNIQKLGTEMFKVKKVLAPKTLNDISVESNENHYNL